MCSCIAIFPTELRCLLNENLRLSFASPLVDTPEHCRTLSGTVVAALEIICRSVACACCNGMSSHLCVACTSPHVVLSALVNLASFGCVDDP